MVKFEEEKEPQAGKEGGRGVSFETEQWGPQSLRTGTGEGPRWLGSWVFRMWQLHSLPPREDERLVLQCCVMCDKEETLQSPRLGFRFGFCP